MRQLGLNQPVSSYSAIYNPKLIEQLGKAAEGVIATSLAPGVTDSPAVDAYVERWKKEVGREPNGLPYTQYLYDAPYIVAAVFKSLDGEEGCRITRRELPQGDARDPDLRPAAHGQAHRDQRRPHRVSKPVYPDGGEGREVGPRRHRAGQLSRYGRPVCRMRRVLAPAVRRMLKDDAMLTFDYHRADPLDVVCDVELLVLFAVALRARAQGQPALQLRAGRGR